MLIGGKEKKERERGECDHYGLGVYVGAGVRLKKRGGRDLEKGERD